MSEQRNHDALPLIEALLDGTIDDAGFARLDAILREDAQARVLYRSYANLYAAMPDAVGQAPRLSVTLSDASGDTLLEPHDMPHDQLIGLLTQLEAQGEDIDPMALAAERFPKQPQASTTGQDWKNAGRYLIGRAKAHRQQVIMGLAAAVMLFAAVVVVIWSQADDASKPIVNVPTPEQPVEDAPAKPNAPLATLTAAHDATWENDFDYGTPDLGDTFRKGRTLTLLSGFAELTTVKDAVVLLEGPCTVVFDAGDNALRLSEGKLVADIPQQAVGFTVNTPTARVVDYGTTFGVEVKQDGTTNAAVFVGEVELGEISDTPDRPTRNVRLTAGWSSHVSRKGVLGREPKPVTAKEHSRFARSINDVVDPGFAYRRAVLASKPLVYWGFEEGTEQTVNLAGQSEFDGTAIGQTDYGQGLLGKGLQLTGDIQTMGGFVSDSPLSFAETKAYTLEAWCWIDRPHHGRVLALAEFDPGRNQRPQHLSMIEVMGGAAIPTPVKRDNATLRFLHRNPISFESADGNNVYTDKPLATGQWVHLAAVHDGKQVRMYINGELAHQSSDGQLIETDRPLSLFVGVSPILLVPQFSQHPTDYRPFAGRIDELAVYGSALNQDTLRTHVALGQNALTR